MRNKPDLPDQPHRGKQLDRDLDGLLARMLNEGPIRSPITRAAVQQALHLKSRSTLVGSRATRIEAARRQQLDDAGFIDNVARKRGSQEAKIRDLQDQVRVLQLARDSYVCQLSDIIAKLQQLGLPVEDSLLALRELEYNQLSS
jgi:hypothetical protein